MKYLSVVATLLIASPGLAANGPPNALKPLLQCQTITDPTLRLSCYDAQTEGLQQATDKSDIMVVDKAEVQKARRSVFGLALDSLSFLDRDAKGHTAQLSEINAKIVTANSDAYGKWHFTLDDGARWMQTESHEFARDPKVGMAIRIRQAAMGSFLANIDQQIAIRVERVR